MSDQKEELSKSEDSPIVPTIAAVTVDLESTADASESKNAEEQIHIASASDSGGYFTDMEGVHEMIKWIKTRIQVAGYNASTMWKDDVHSSIAASSPFATENNYNQMYKLIWLIDILSCILIYKMVDTMTNYINSS